MSGQFFLAFNKEFWKSKQLTDSGFFLSNKGDVKNLILSPWTESLVQAEGLSENQLWIQKTIDGGLR